MRRSSHGGGHPAGSRSLVVDLEFDPTKVPQSRALKDYGLNLEDLKPLRVTRTLNPVDPSYAPMKLYSIYDLMVRACGTLSRSSRVRVATPMPPPRVPCAGRGQLWRARCRDATCDAVRSHHCALVARCAQRSERVRFACYPPRASPKP
jgi:hypothetical protein